FRMVEDMGFDVMGEYFCGTSQLRKNGEPGFPIPIDQQGTGDVQDGRTIGRPDSTGVDRFEFGELTALSNIGNATDARTVMHEFCHALLYDRIHAPNLAFSHSAGDSLAAIYFDPDSRLADKYRFLTFPWTSTTLAGSLEEANAREDKTSIRRQDRFDL